MSAPEASPSGQNQQLIGQPSPSIEGQRILQVRLSAELYEWLRTSAFYERRSMNAIVNEALERFKDAADRD